jgi:hypothetical protein
MVAGHSPAPYADGTVSRSPVLLLMACFAVFAGPSLVAAQGAPSGDTNIPFPVEYIEARMLAPELDILDMDRSRPLEADRNRRVTLGGPDGEPPIDVHWKPVAPPGHGFNNEPRYELAAYRLQKLFLEEPEYVVPPTVLRAMSMEAYNRIRPVNQPTIRGTRSVLFLLSYWVQNLAVDTVDPFDPNMFERVGTYTTHFANANLLTHLIDHKDGNHGNVLVSMDGLNVRVFAVDNDVAFRSRVSDRGDRWRHLQVDRLPAATVERLRTITREDLDAQLGVVAEFRVTDGYLEPVEAGPNLQPRRGVRVQDDRVQFGLTRGEIGDVERRIQRVLRDVDRGRLSTF